MEVFISGCAKTRTTLVQWLFSAFENTVVIPGEMQLWVFRNSGIHYFRPHINLVAKRTANSILANKITREEFKDQVSRISLDDIKLVRVTRNKKDTLASENGYVDEDRWTVCEEHARLLRPLIAVEINTDRLMRKPDIVQKEVAKALGLEIEHKWSKWPDFAPKSQMIDASRYPKMFNRLG